MGVYLRPFIVFSWFGLVRNSFFFFVPSLILGFFKEYFYITFSILSTALEDPTFGLKGINIANIFINYFYPCSLVACFILALGNHPQGSK